LEAPVDFEHEYKNLLQRLDAVEHFLGKGSSLDSLSTEIEVLRSDLAGFLVRGAPVLPAASVDHLTAMSRRLAEIGARFAKPTGSST